MALTTKALLNTTRQKNDGTYPLVIRMTYNRRVINIPIGYSLKEIDWDSENQRIKSSSKVATNITRLNKVISEKSSKIYDVVARLEDEGKINRLSVKDIKKLIISDGGNQNVNVFDFIQSIMDDLVKAKKTGNAEVYKGLLNKLKKFYQGESLTFDEINYSFLKNFETIHYTNGNEPGGLSVYFRTLRAVYNRAIKAGHASPDKYPFRDYKIKNGEPHHRALTEMEFEQLKSVELKSGSVLDEALKLFMASFYMRGMNWMDMSLLRFNNIEEDFDRILYVRSKTHQRFSIKITERLRDIIHSYEKPNGSVDDFIFPILNNQIPESKYYETIKNKRKRLNTRLKDIAELCEMDRFTIYAARHTYATMGKRKGVPTAVIQESLGHKTETITQTYLDSFDNKVVDDYDELIMSD